MKAEEIAEIVAGKLVGNGDVEIEGVNEIQIAKEGELTFLSNSKYEKYLKTTEASAVIVGKIHNNLSVTQIVCDEPYVAFAKVVHSLFPEKFPDVGISCSAKISESAVIGGDVYIGENVFIGENVKIGNRAKIFPNVFIGDNSEIGDDSVIFPGVVVYKDVKIGKRVRIHAGTVIGSDGFGYAFSKKEGNVYKVPQIGGVTIEDDVEIGSNTSIDRGTIGNTVIGRGTKIDNLVQIGHNVKIGENSFIVSQVGISGSTKVGSYVTLAGQVGVAGHLEITDNVIVAAKSGIPKSITKPGVYAGIPVMDVKLWRKTRILIAKLPEIYEKVRKLFPSREKK